MSKSNSLEEILSKCNSKYITTGLSGFKYIANNSIKSYFKTRANFLNIEPMNINLKQEEKKNPTMINNSDDTEDEDDDPPNLV